MRRKSHPSPMMLIIIPVLFHLAYFVIGSSLVSYTNSMSKDPTCSQIDPGNRSVVSFYGWFIVFLSGLSLIFTATNLLL